MKDLDFFKDVEYLLKAWQRNANADDYWRDIQEVLEEIEQRKIEQEIFFASLKSKSK
jgi:hypothetical protein